VEVIVADWGSEIPLRDVLKLTQEAARIVSFLHIPPDIARAEQKDSPFPEVLAINAAARRASGEFIGRIDQDTLVGRYFLEKFFWLHEKQRMLVPFDKAVMLSNRRRIPYRFAVLCPSFWAVNRYLRWFGRVLPLMEPPPPHLPYRVYIGILVFHRDLWNQCGGYDERFIYMDFMELDLILRLVKQYVFVDLGEIVNYDFYHLDHSDPRKSWGFDRNRPVNPEKTLDNPPEELNPTGENWGLIQYPMELRPSFVNQLGVNVAAAAGSLIDWFAFIGALLLSSTQIAADRLILKIEKGRDKIIKLMHRRIEVNDSI
jgi:hypothetical protein